MSTEVGNTAINCHIDGILNACISQLDLDDSLGTPNKYECQDIFPVLQKFFSTYPLTTNLIRKYYPFSSNAPSSCGSEFYYEILRNSYKMNKPCFLNPFLLEHMSVIFVQYHVTMHFFVILRENLELLAT